MVRNKTMVDLAMGQITEKKNPFTRDFGTVTSAFIERRLQQDDIERSFIDEITDDKAYFIIGQRGFGKSSFLRDIKNKISRYDEWLVYELRSNNENLIHEFAASMYAEPVLNAQFISLQLDFSIIGLGASLSAKTDRRIEISSDEVAVKKMLEVASNLKKKVLIVIDEISNTPSIQALCALFNVCKGDGLPLYMLMDGLYQNTTTLENVKDLTFLKRVQKLNVGLLEKGEMFNLYKKFLHLESGKDLQYADRLAGLTKGYPYAFQLVGYYTWLWLKDDSELLNRDYGTFENNLCMELDRNLHNYVYSTIWGEISQVEKDICSIIACYSLNKVQGIRTRYNEIFPERAEMTSSNFSGYRDKLIKLNILRSNANTYLEFALPRFDIYAQINRNERITFDFE